MKGRRLAPWLLVLSLVSACGFDGGTSGTGITGGTSGTGVTSETLDPESGISVVEGNVSSLRGARRSGSEPSSILLAELRKLFALRSVAVADGGIEGIRVWIEGTSIEDRTGSDGRFSLAGSFDESVTIVFERASGEQARLETLVPSGGRLTLDDVVVDLGTGVASVGDQTVRFEGVVVDTECARQAVRVASRFDAQGLEYTVFTDGAKLRRADGRLVRCAALEEGDAVRIEGPIEPDGTIGADSRQTSESMMSLGF